MRFLFVAAECEYTEIVDIVAEKLRTNNLKFLSLNAREL